MSWETNLLEFVVTGWNIDVTIKDQSVKERVQEINSGGIREQYVSVVFPVTIRTERPNTITALT